MAAAGAGDLSGFDSEGYANMRFAVTLDEKHFPKTKKQRPLWPALCNADDFGCEWYVTAVYSIVNCILSSGGGDHPRLNMLARQAASWETQGSEQGLRDGALLSWLFTKIAKFLEIEEPTAVAANLMNWSLRQGLALKYFIPMARSADLLAILAEEAQGADHYSTAPLEDRPVYPTNLVSYGKGINRGGGISVGGAGRSLPSKPNRDSIAASAEKEARKAAAHEEQQRCQVQYAIYEICITVPGRTPACFNSYCGSTEHVFARCDADYSADNWDAAVQRQPWVVKFRSSTAEGFKQLCARAVQGAERGERGRSAQSAFHRRGNGGGRGGYRSGYSGGGASHGGGGRNT
ncbi:hypothetical protein JKP88DRAFT_280434 [Tribonema minus]|uniref:Uncharacterized protein n=1 Tax=Tribonema minus TaxID=303371 RepID=A0A836CCQ5_9STRA|nr:hypothetical protein JKP88DRAFT_280434 [Tribonema minus]